MDTPIDVTEFFDRYTEALLDRDAGAVAQMYAVPGLILFPGQAVPVSSIEQTEQFFAAAMSQYDKVTATRAEIDVRAATAQSVWADVTWHHEGVPPERLMYQLVGPDRGWQIAVLTPME